MKRNTLAFLQTGIIQLLKRYFSFSKAEPKTEIGE